MTPPPPPSLVFSRFCLLLLPSPFTHRAIAGTRVDECRKIVEIKGSTKGRTITFLERGMRNIEKKNVCKHDMRKKKCLQRR